MAKKARAKKGASKAKGRKAAAPKKAAAQAVPHPYKTTPGNILVSLLNGKKSTKKKTFELNTEFGKQIAHAVEHNALNKKAFAMVEKLWALKDDPQEVRTLWDVINVYFKDTGLQEIYNSAPPLEGMEAGNDPGFEDAADAEHPEDEGGEQTEAFPEDPDQQVAAE